MKYFAFISYSHTDAKIASSLARFIETFRVPVRLGGLDDVLPKRMSPVFRDREEFSASADLGASITNALADSGALVVLCSPNSSRSQWVNEEIRTFRRIGNPSRIFPVLIEGEPRQAFPPALTETGGEPLAIDLRAGKDRPLDARLRLAAALLGVDFDALKQREKRRIRTARMRAAAVVALLLLLAGVGLSRYWTIANTQRADQLARLSLTRAASDPIGDLLAAQAYAAAATPRTRGAMLARLTGVPGLVNVAVPPLRNEDDSDFADRTDFFDNGSKLAIAGGDNALTVLDARTLAFISRTPLSTRARFVCGLSNPSRVVVADASNLRVQVPLGDSSHLFTTTPVAGLSSVVCTTRGVVLLGKSDGRVLRLNPTNMHAVFVTRVPSARPILGIGVSPSGKRLALITAVTIEVVASNDGKRVATFGSSPPDCAPGRCGSAVSFSRSDKTFAWFGRDNAIYVSALSGKHAPVRYAADCLNAAIADVSDDSPPLAMSSGGICRFDAAAKRYTYTQAYAPSGARPVYDPQLQLFVDPGGDTLLSAYSISGTRAPLLGTQPASPWRRGWALHGGSLIIAGIKGYNSYDLDAYRSQFATENDVRNTLLVRDIADGRHAIAFDPAAGSVQIVDLAATGPRIVASFHVQPARGYGSSAFLEGQTIAYDPHEGIVSVATANDLRRYGSGGALLGSASWARIAAAAALRRPQSWSFDQISARGTFAVLTDGSSYAVVPLHGGAAIPTPSAVSISPDERFALATTADGTLRLLRLPSLVPVPGVDITQANRYDRPAISPDGKIVAYQDGRQRVQLYDVVARMPIGGPLPAPPEMERFPQETMAFSADDRYLVMGYATPARTRFVAVYAIDPAQWERLLCLRAGTRTSAKRVRDAVGSLARPSPCGAFASQMVPASP